MDHKLNTRMCSDALSLVGILLTLYLSWQWQELKLHLISYRQATLNVTHLCDPESLVFNRVPKVGSEMFWEVIDKLAPLNGFTSFSDSHLVKRQRQSENTYLQSYESRKTYHDILVNNLTKPFTYTKHINFIDFTEFEDVNPIYVNLVRHPVDRVVSWYYYHRSPWHIIHVDKETNRSNVSPNVPSVHQLKLTFEDCVLGKYAECTFHKGQGIHMGVHGGSHYSQIAFFCGHHPECNIFESPTALALAMDHVEQHYAVVGDLSLAEETMAVLEAYVPRFFKGVTQVYFEQMREVKKNKNIYKPKTDPRLRHKLLGNFSLEIQFYEFCRQRLHKQYLALL